MGVNATDLAAAAAIAQAFALRPRDMEGNWKVYDGYVECTEINAIDKRDWPEVTRELAPAMDEIGVYFATEPAFRADLSKLEIAELLNPNGEPLDPA